MITEDYISYEVAKLLKEKGFDEKVISFYSPGDIQRPTLQMAMKWLREVHGIFIDIMSRFSMNADKDVCFYYSCKKLGDTYKSCHEYKDGEWLNHEQACEAAIKYCLENLIQL